jgi:hypothetical protein
MKQIFLLFIAVLMFSCSQPNEITKIIEKEKESPEVVTPIVEEEAPEETPAPAFDPLTDPRTSAFSAVSYEWINYPVTGGRSMARGIKKDKTTVDKCNKPGWNYMFFDDEAVIGYEPPEGNYDVMLNAIKITVESHNREFPEKPWDYHTVAPPPPPPPVTSFDPVLGHWQCALVLDDGTIVDGLIYTAEFEWNWTGWKGGTMNLVMESYNLDHPDNKAHLVWGTE